MALQVPPSANNTESDGTAAALQPESEAAASAHQGVAGMSDESVDGWNISYGTLQMVY